MSNTKDAILSRIRTAIASWRKSHPDDYAAIQRRYTQTGVLDDAGRIALFTERLHDYDATVYRATAGDIANVIREALSHRNASRLLVTPDVPEQWLPEGFTYVRDGALPYDEIDAMDGVISPCATAIAVTGTIVLRHSREHGRRALSLVPDYHLCIVYEHQVVETVPEGIRVLAAFGTDTLTTISGPSATADIEMIRVKGVHGPRTLDVVLMAGSGS